MVFIRLQLYNSVWDIKCVWYIYDEEIFVDLCNISVWTISCKKGILIIFEVIAEFKNVGKVIHIFEK